MRKITFILFSVFVAVDAHSAESRYEKRGGTSTRESLLAKVVPAEYGQLHLARAVGPDKAADSAISVLAAVRTKLRAERLKAEYDCDVLDAYAAAWRLCLRSRKESSNTHVREAILEEWNRQLKAEDDEIPLQMAASWTLDVWDRELLSVEFWQLLQTTEKQKTLNAICWLLYSKGDLRDAEALKTKMQFTQDVKLKAIIKNTLSWMTYKHLYASDPSNPGPPSDPPQVKID